jgi:hypothetical protein
MRIRAIAIGVVVVAAIALLLAGLGAGSTSKRHATLRLVKPAPLQLVGSHFVARERVRVTASADGASVSKRVRASHRGTFAVAFAFGAGHCAGLRVVAVGSAGSRVTLKRLPLPACMPQ